MNRIISRLPKGNYRIIVDCVPQEGGSYVHIEVFDENGQSMSSLGPSPRDAPCDIWTFRGALELFNTNIFKEGVERLDLYEKAYWDIIRQMYEAQVISEDFFNDAAGQYISDLEEDFHQQIELLKEAP